MIKSFLSLAFATILMGTFAYAQTSTSSTTVATGTNGTTETTTTENMGTVTEFTPGATMILKTEAAEPVHYKFSKNVTYTTPDGRTIKASTIVKNSKVRVHYLKDGDNMVVDRVILTPDRE